MIVVDGKSYENILIYYIAYKTPYSVKSLPIIFDGDGYIRRLIELNIYQYFFLIKNMKGCLIELDVKKQYLICMFS